MKLRAALLTLFLIFSSLIYSQTIFVFDYFYGDDDADKQVFKAMLLRYDDGTGIIRVRWSENNELQLTEMTMQEAYYGEKASDGKAIDSSILVFHGSDSRVILGSAAITPDEFWFVRDKKTGFYELSSITEYSEDANEEENEATFTDYKLINDEDLTEDLVKLFFTKDDEFYKSRIVATVRPLSQQQSQAKLHLIVVANTNDPSISASTEADKKAISYFFEQVAGTLKEGYEGKLNFELTKHEIYGDKYSKASVVQAINDTKKVVGTNDIVVFYYSGHGFNDKGKASMYPSLDLRPGDHLPFNANSTMSIEEIFGDIKNNMKPRLTLVIGDCCNTEVGLSSIPGSSLPTTRPSGIGWNINNCADLFMNPRRQAILIAAASKGELSAGLGTSGGLFTSTFKAQLIKCMSGAFYSKGDWTNIIEQTKVLTAKTANETNCRMPDNSIEKCKQKPLGIIQ